MSSVKIMGGPMKQPPKPSRDADIKGQGKTPYCQMKEEKTPSIGEGKVTTGKKRGMGAALRGNRFTSA